MNIEIATSSLVATGGSLTDGWGVTPHSLLAYRAVSVSKIRFRIPCVYGDICKATKKDQSFLTDPLFCDERSNTAFLPPKVNLN